MTKEPGQLFDLSTARFGEVYRLASGTEFLYQYEAEPGLIAITWSNGGAGYLFSADYGKARYVRFTRAGRP